MESEINKLSQKERDKQELENLKQGYIQCKETYKMQRERFKNSDEKLNWLLIFNALVLLITINISLNKLFGCVKTLMYIFLILFGLSMLITLILIICGLYPRKTTFIDNNNYTNDKFYHCTNVEFFGKMIGQFTNYNNCIHKKIEQKYLFYKIALIFTSINILSMVMLIIIKMI